MTANPETDPTAYVEVLARLLCAADVHVHGDEHPTWQHLVGETGSRIRDDYRAAARWLAARLTVAPAAPVSSVPDHTTHRDLMAALAEDLRYVLNYRGPDHAHERPGVWDTSGRSCMHCARLAVARMNLADYDDAPVPPPTDRATILREAADAVAQLKDKTDVNVAEYQRYDFRQRCALGHAEALLRRLAAEAQPPAVVAPSARAGLRDQIINALGQITTVPPIAHRRAQADNVLAVLYREWPWLRAEAEDAPAAGVRQPDTETPTAALVVELERKADGWRERAFQNSQELGAALDAIGRVRQLHDRLAEETDLASPDDLITRGAAAKRIATALDGWNPTGAPQCDVEFEGGGRCAKPAGHRPPGSDDPHVPAVSGRPAADGGGEETQFGVEGCTCRPFTRQESPPRYLDRPTDTVDMISGWEIADTCPHHKKREAGRG